MRTLTIQRVFVFDLNKTTATYHKTGGHKNYSCKPFLLLQTVKSTHLYSSIPIRFFCSVTILWGFSCFSHAKSRLGYFFKICFTSDKFQFRTFPSSSGICFCFFHLSFILSTNRTEPILVNDQELKMGHCLIFFDANLFIWRKVVQPTYEKLQLISCKNCNSCVQSSCSG